MLVEEYRLSLVWTESLCQVRATAGESVGRVTDLSWTTMNLRNMLLFPTEQTYTDYVRSTF